MLPVLLRLGPLQLYSYGAFMALAFLIGLALARLAARALPDALRAITANQLVDFCSVGLLSGIAGGRLYYVLMNWQWFVMNPWEVFAIWHGGLVWYGGFAGGLLGAWSYVRRHGLDFVRVFDQFIPFLALGHGIGRLGCFLNGCCYGRPTDSWCGVLFPGHESPVWPTQLFEAAGLFLLYLLLRRLQTPEALRRRGRVFGAYLCGYAALRFLIEQFRGDQPAWLAGFTLAQALSVGLFIAGAVVTLRAKKGRG